MTVKGWTITRMDGMFFCDRDGFYAKVYHDGKHITDIYTHTVVPYAVFQAIKDILKGQQ